MTMEEINQVGQVLLGHEIGAPMHYMHDELVNIGNMVKVDPGLKILNHNVCTRIRQLRLNTRVSRGGKGKRKLLQTSLNGQTGVNYDNIRPLSTKIGITYNNNNRRNFNLDLINVQLLRSKELMLLDYLDSTHLDACILTETWLRDCDEYKIWLEVTTLNKGVYKLSYIGQK